MRHAFKLKVVQFALDLLLDSVEAFVVKALQRLAILVNHFHVVTHFFRIGLDDVRKAGVFRKTLQDVLQYRGVAHVVVLLRSRHDRHPTAIDDISCEVLVGSR